MIRVPTILTYIVYEFCLCPLASPSMRGATPLDVAAASVMDNNELALALKEPDLQKVNCYSVPFSKVLLLTVLIMSCIHTMLCSILRMVCYCLLLFSVSVISLICCLYSSVQVVQSPTLKSQFCKYIHMYVYYTLLTPRLIPALHSYSVECCPQ